jgi:uncharacterized Fe-S cluster protein YjdI
MGGEKMTERTSDPSHDEPDEAPEGFREQPRYAPEVERAYANDRIEVTWEPAFCIHVAECLRGLPAVFDNQRRPWIIVDNGSPGDIGEVIQRCPRARCTSAAWTAGRGSRCRRKLRYRNARTARCSSAATSGSSIRTTRWSGRTRG